MTVVIEDIKSLLAFYHALGFENLPITVRSAGRRLPGLVMPKKSTEEISRGKEIRKDGFRNRAIREAILQSDKEENRLATFTATEIGGLHDSVTPGTSYELTITGDLTIKGTTRQVSFDAIVTPVSGDRIEGSASLSVPYADFGVDIPFLPPQVASVEDIVRLEIDLVAAR